MTTIAPSITGVTATAILTGSFLAGPSLAAPIYPL